MSAVTVVYDEDNEYWSIRVDGLERETVRSHYDLGEVFYQAERYCAAGQNAWQRVDSDDNEWAAVTAR